MTDTAAGRVAAYLRTIGVEMPPGRFVAIVSNVYHRLEAERYDAVHAEIDEAAVHWSAALRAVAPLLPDRVRALDVGAGTGFAAARIAEALGPRLGELVCLDLSPDILRLCRERLGSLTTGAAYVAGPIECLQGGGFDLVVTNSVLHHMLDLRGFLAAIRSLVKVGGVYIAGHEPSDAFYADRRLYRWTERYRAWRKLRKLVDPAFYLRRVGLADDGPGIEEQTSRELMAMSVIREPLAPGVVRQLVDIHVPPASPSVPFWGEPGFNGPDLLARYLPGFEPVHMVTYPHIKEARARMGPLWRAIDDRLARRHPNSGANFLMAVRRVE